MNVDVVVCIPSRGLIHSRTMEAIERNMEHRIWKPVFEHQKKIPDSHNGVVAQAVEHDPTWIWMVEEDMEPPAGCFKNLVAFCNIQKAAVATAKYKVEGGSWSHLLDKSGRLRYAGVGCMMINYSVIQKVKRPWFSTDFDYQVDYLSGDFTKRPAIKGESRYGRHDIHFFAVLDALGLKYVLSDIECPHLHVKSWGEENCNDGCHEIRAF